MRPRLYRPSMALLFLSTRGLLHTAAAGCSHNRAFGRSLLAPRGVRHRTLAFSATSSSSSASSSDTPTPISTELLSTSSVNGVRTRSFHVAVPLDHSSPSSSPPLRVFVREVLLEQDASSGQYDANAKKTLLYLQGGPGFPAGRPTFPL